MVALVLTFRLERSEVGAGIGLRIALAPAYLPPRDLWEKPLLLLLGAVFEERRPQHGNPKTHERIACVDRGHLLTQDLGFGRRESAPAIFFRPFRSEEHTSELQSLMRNSYAVFSL